MRIYARLKPDDYANYVELATRTDAGSAKADDLPEIDPCGVVADHEATTG